MINTQSPIAAALLTLALAVPAVAWAESNSERELNAATFSNSESVTQVQEEQAVEQKDGMDAPQAQPGDSAKPQASDAATGAAAAPK